MKAQPFVISKQLVMQAYRLVKANRGAAGVDHQSLDDFEEDLKSNLYRVWNRMSSGRYCPAPVKAVSIPKKSGGERVLGVPTVADRERWTPSFGQVFVTAKVESGVMIQATLG